jgi:hypothetical protein
MTTPARDAAIFAAVLILTAILCALTHWMASHPQAP